MRPARFVTLCFVYSGLILLMQYVTVYQHSFEITGLAQLGVALSILATGVYRLWDSDVESENPSKYGLFTYGMAILSLILTGLFLGQLFLL